MRGPDSMKYIHMILCVCLNRAQQWLTATCLLFSAASEGRIRNLRQIRDFFGSILALWSHLGPSPEFGTLLVPPPFLSTQSRTATWMVHQLPERIKMVQASIKLPMSYLMLNRFLATLTSSVISVMHFHLKFEKQTKNNMWSTKH